MLILKKRQIILSALIVMILVAGYLNVSHRDEVENIKIGDEKTSSINDEEATVSKNLGEAKLVNETENTKTENRKEQVQNTDVDSTKDQAQEKVVAKVDAGNEYFIEARMQREQARGEALEVIKAIVDNKNSGPEIKENAQKQMMEISKNMEKEAITENLIKAKGFPEAVVFIDEGIDNVVVKSEGLVPAQTAQITDIVVSQTGVEIDKVKILEIK